MTKKDYILIADCIKRAKTKPINEDQLVGVWHVQLNITNALKRENNKFNIKKFLEACGYKNVINLDNN